MDYIIVVTILAICICLTKADEDNTFCKDGEECMDLIEDKQEECVQLVQYFLDKTNDDSQVKYCNTDKTKVCCTPHYIPETISERKCLELENIKGFCAEIPLIANGGWVEPNSLPFMALIKFDDPNKKEQPNICGGVLIERQWVLTAGHCFDVVENNKNLMLTVYLGAHNTSDSGIPFKGTEIKKHPGYGGNDSLADLALIRLDRAAEITDSVKPACLVKNNSSRPKEYFGAGWGLNGTLNAKHLQKTNLVPKKLEECKDGDLIPDSTKQLCLQPQQPFGDVCKGDSGGPIFVKYPGHGNCYIEVLGVVSVGIECQTRGSFTLHTRIDYYREWIEGVVWPGETMD